MKTILRNTILLALIFLFSSAFSQKNIKKYAKTNLSSVGYSMSHPMHDWDGINKNVRAIIVENKDGVIEKLAVSLNIIDFDSGNANRDSHAIEVLEGIKYPTISFVSTKVKDTNEQYKVTGILTFHNVKKEITITFIKNKTNNSDAYIGNFEVDMTEFGIKRPTLLNMPTDKIIKIKFSIVF